MPPAVEPPSSPGEITRWLRAWEEGDPTAFDHLVPLLYGELRVIAARRLCPRDTLDTTELVHEAYLQLRGQRRAHWQDRSQFFAVVARIMRRLLADRSRRRWSAKRGGGQRPAQLDQHGREPGLPLAGASDLDLTLRDLARLQPDLARVVELRFFVGLTNDQIAEALGISPATVNRRARLARAWLCRQMEL